MKDKAQISLSYEEPGKSGGNAQQPPSRAPRFEDLWGTIRVVSSAPTWTPRGRLEDSLALYVNAGTRRLYIYDQSTTSWHYVTLT